MGVETVDEKAAHAMMPTWMQLPAVRAYEQAQRDAIFELFANSTEPVELTEVWSRRVFEAANNVPLPDAPTVWDLVLADRAGKLDELIAQQQ